MFYSLSTARQRTWLLLVCGSEKAFSKEVIHVDHFMSFWRIQRGTGFIVCLCKFHVRIFFFLPWKFFKKLLFFFCLISYWAHRRLRHHLPFQSSNHHVQSGSIYLLLFCMLDRAQFGKTKFYLTVKINSFINTVSYWNRWGRVPCPRRHWFTLNANLFSLIARQRSSNQIFHLKPWQYRMYFSVYFHVLL